MLTFLGGLAGVDGCEGGGGGGGGAECRGVRLTQVGARRCGIIAPTGGVCSVRSSDRR